jgi:hypothetical protein
LLEARSSHKCPVSTYLGNATADRTRLGDSLRYGRGLWTRRRLPAKTASRPRSPSGFTFYDLRAKCASDKGQIQRIPQHGSLIVCVKFDFMPGNWSTLRAAAYLLGERILEFVVAEYPKEIL